MSRSRSTSFFRKKSPVAPSPPTYRHRDNRSGSVEKPRNAEHSRIRSRSRCSRRNKSRYSHSKSRSISPDDKRKSNRRRSHSRSPTSDRRRHASENPQKSRCLGVFGLNVYTTREQIIKIFERYGTIDRVQVVVDAKSGRSRGYCFVYYHRTEDAKVAKENCSGMELDSRIIRVDYSITQRPHTPTPGVYMGRPTRSNRDYDRRGGGGDDEYNYRERRSSRDRGSPSPYRHRERRRRYDRSRSRSFSPRDRRYR